MKRMVHIRFKDWKELCIYLINTGDVVYCLDRSNGSEKFNLTYSRNSFTDKAGRLTYVSLIIDQIDLNTLNSNFYILKEPTLPELLKEEGPKLCRVSNPNKAKVIRKIIKHNVDNDQYYDDEGNWWIIAEILSDDELSKLGLTNIQKE